jgi:hypothetical protein
MTFILFAPLLENFYARSFPVPGEATAASLRPALPQFASIILHFFLSSSRGVSTPSKSFCQMMNKSGIQRFEIVGVVLVELFEYTVVAFIDFFVAGMKRCAKHALPRHLIQRKSSLNT